MELQKRFSILITLFFAIAFVFYAFRVSIHVASILVIVSTLGYALLARRRAITLPPDALRDIKLLALSFSLYFLVSIPPLLLNHGWEDSWKFQDAFIRFAIFALILVLIFRFDIQIREKLLYGCLFVGGILNSIAAFIERIFFNEERVHLLNGIFQFGYFSSIIALICFNLFLHQKTTKPIKILSFITFVLCSVAVFLGISRGIILGYFMGLLFSFLIHLVHQPLLSIVKKSLLLCACTAVLFASIPSFYQPLITRTKEIQSETTSFDGKKQETSIGDRFKIWDHGVSMFKLSPLFGMNIKTRKEQKDLIAENSVFKIRINSIEHIGESHNQSINALAKNGIIGYLGLCFLIFSVSVVCLRKLRSSAFLYPSCLISILILYVADGCFNTPLDSKVEAPLFCFCVILLLKLYYQHTSKPNQMGGGAIDGILLNHHAHL